jgi:hypothetical protein
MKIQEIETAVMKQLPFKRYHEPGKADQFLNCVNVKKDRYLDIGMVIICGLSTIYLNESQKKVVAYYDITPKGFNTNVTVFNKHLARVAEIMHFYGAKDYKDFSEKFWTKHNQATAGEIFKSGIILSHVVSSKKEFSKFIKDNTELKDEDYLSFFIYNKTHLTKNYLSLRKKEYVDSLLAF